MTPEEIELFLEMSPIEFDLIDPNQSFTTNFYLLDNNTKANQEYLSTTLEFIKFLYSLVNPEEMVINVINTLMTNKLNIPIANSIPVDNSVVHTFNDIIYRIKRVNDFL